MDPIPNQIIGFEGQRYAIPQENLKELVRIPSSEVKSKIDKVGQIPVVRIRQKFLPLLDLSDVLGIREKNNRRTNPASAVNIAVVNSEGYTYGLVVDKFHDAEDLDILPAGRYLSGCVVYLGTAILKDEKAALVLDIFNIAHSSGLSHTVEKVESAVSDSGFKEARNSENYTLLTFKNSDSEHFAVDLDAVDRLERFKFSDFEKIGNGEVVQYRGRALALFEISQVLPASSLPESHIQEVIVLKYKGVLAGLKITPPVDTFEGRLSLDDSTFNKSPIKGSVIINGNTTLLLDAPAMLTGWEERFSKVF